MTTNTFDAVAPRCETCDHGAEVQMWRGLGHMRGGCATCDCAALTGELFPGMWPVEVAS